MNKFNLSWKNKGEWQPGDPVWNAEMGQKVTDNIDELIDDADNKNIMSQDEVPIGTWTDGKTIYRKVFIGKTSSSARTNLATGIDNLINSYGYMLIPGGYAVNPNISGGNAAFYFFIELDRGKNVLSINCSSDFYERPYEFVVEYTKI